MFDRIQLRFLLIVFFTPVFVVAAALFSDTIWVALICGLVLGVAGAVAGADLMLKHLDLPAKATWGDVVAAQEKRRVPRA